MDSPTQKFFVSDDGKEKVSITKAELLAGIDSGKHTDASLAWTKGMGPAWLPLSDPHWESHGILIEPQPPELPPPISDLQSGGRKVPRNDKGLGSRTYKILEHPTFGKKAVSIQAWSWLGFFFFGWYFLFLGRFRLFFKQVVIAAIGFTPLKLYMSFGSSESAIDIYLLTSLIVIPLILYVHGGLRGGKARFENLLEKGYITIDEVSANNTSHALSLHEN